LAARLKTNLGWYGTVFLIYLLFCALLAAESRLGRAQRTLRTAGRNPFYALCAVGNVAQMLGRAYPAVVQDPSGKQWRVADITNASAWFPSSSWEGLCCRLGEAGHWPETSYRLNSSLSRLVWARLTGISVCFLSFMRSW